MQTLNNHNIIVQHNYQHRLHHINAIIHASTQYKIIKETQICANTLTTPQIYHATSARTQHDARIVHQRQRKHKSSSGESHLQLKHNTSRVSITYLCFLSTLYINCTDNVNYIKYTKDTTPTGRVLATQLNTTSHGGSGGSHTSITTQKIV